MREIAEGSLEQSPAEPKPLPAELAERFAAGTILENAPIVHEGDKSNIYRLYEEAESVPGVPDARLRVDYRKYHETQKGKWDQLRFEYTAPDAQDPQTHNLVAEMHLGLARGNTFGLDHRYVWPEYKNIKGIGTQLLTRAESWVQQVADTTHKEKTIALQAGQESVIKWVEKQGYVVSESDQALLQEMQEFPERFTQDEVIPTDDSAAAGIIKDPYTFRIDTKGRHEEDALRLTFEKHFEPMEPNPDSDHDLRNEDVIARVLVSGSDAEMAELKKMHNLTDEQLESFRYWSRVRNETKEGERLEPRELTEEEKELGVRIEYIEPQVLDAVRAFTKKGYKTVYSGFERLGTAQTIWTTEEQAPLNPLPVEAQAAIEAQWGVTITYEPHAIWIDCTATRLTGADLKELWRMVTDALPEYAPTK